MASADSSWRIEVAAWLDQKRELWVETLCELPFIPFISIKPHSKSRDMKGGDANDTMLRKQHNFCELFTQDRGSLENNHSQPFSTYLVPCVLFQGTAHSFANSASPALSRLTFHRQSSLILRPFRTGQYPLNPSMKHGLWPSQSGHGTLGT